MKMGVRYRETILDARRVVVKIGTRVLVGDDVRPRVARMRQIVTEMAAMHAGGSEVALVSSGSIGSGMEVLRAKKRPTRLPDLQMTAAVGQCRLMSRYEKLFGDKKCIVGQVLLTRENFRQKVRLVNARRTLENLLRNRVIPVINENDAVADDEIRAVDTLGDNDLLSALVAKLIRADLLIMLSTVGGVYRTNGKRRERIPYLETVSRSTIALATGKGSELSTGGMASKLRAAQMAAKSGVGVVIADGRKKGTLTRIMNGEDAGTFVLPSV